MNTLLKTKTVMVTTVCLIMLLTCICGTVKVSAVESAHTLEEFPLQSNLVVGQDDMTSYFRYKPYSDSSYSKMIDVKADNVVVSSSNPSILRAEIFQYTSSDYYVRVVGVSPGTAVLTVNIPSENLSGNMTIRVWGKENVIIEEFPTDQTINKGDTIYFDSRYDVSCWADGEEFYSSRISLEDCKVTSGNKKILSVRKMSGSGYFADSYLKAVGAGTTTVTVTVEKEGELKGLKKSFKVTVKQGPKATAPTLLKQTAFSSYLLYNRMDVGYKLKKQEAVYELWRSKSPKKNFKKVGTIKVTKDAGLGDYGYFKVPYMTGAQEGGSTVYFDDYSKKYPLKANTKYYYKMRVKYTGEYYNNNWSKWSAVRTYWTPPKPIANNKVKFNEKTKKVTIPKVKNVAGYIYTASGIEKLGYNVFGQPVYYAIDDTKTTKKRVFKVKRLREGMPASDVEDVIPYAKHGDYYYAHGYTPVKKLSKYKAWDSRKFT